jgi:hypothetical protein
MRDRSVPILKIVCLGLAALIVYQLSQFATRRDPLAAFNQLAPALASAKTQPPPAPKPATNAPAAPRPGPPAQFAPPGPFGMRGMGAMPPQPPLPADIQARIDRVTQSEILAPIQRPMPMALLGIAGRDVFLRASNGQTGLVREGGELGGVKVLKIGTNRVLVEQDGRQQELMIFSGFGGESLLPQGKDQRP